MASRDMSDETLIHRVYKSPTASPTNHLHSKLLESTKQKPGTTPTAPPGPFIDDTLDIGVPDIMYVTALEPNDSTPPMGAGTGISLCVVLSINSLDGEATSRISLLRKLSYI